MKRVRPTSVTVMGILNIVFGSLSLLCVACAGIIIMIALNADPRILPGGRNPMHDLWDFMKREAPSYQFFLILRLGLGVLLSVLLLIAGIGLLNMQNWGRGLSLVCAIIGTVFYIADMVYQLAVENPAAQRWATDFQRRNPGLMIDGGMGNNALQTVIAIGGDLIRIIYCILLVIIMLTPRVSAAFSGRPVSDYEAEARDDEGDEYERGRQRDGWND
jgi:hypothetical protein